MPLTQKQSDILNQYLKANLFNGLDDRTTRVTKKQISKQIHAINELKDEIVSNFQKHYTLKLRDGIHSPRCLVTALRQLIRASNCRLISEKKYVWDTEQKKQKCILEYYII